MSKVWRERVAYLEKDIARMDARLEKDLKKWDEPLAVLGESINLYDKWNTGKKKTEVLKTYGETQDLTYNKKTKKFSGESGIVVTTTPTGSNTKPQKFSMTQAQLQAFKDLNELSKTPQNIRESVLAGSGVVMPGYEYKAPPVQTWRDRLFSKED